MKRKTETLHLAENWLSLGQEPLSATRIGVYVYTAGVPGIELTTGNLPDTPAAQFANAFENLRAILDAHGVGPESIALLSVYIPDASYREYINDPWLAMYPDDSRPARKTNQVPLLAGMFVQLQAVCVVGAARQAIEIPGMEHRDPLPMGMCMGPMVLSSVIGGQDPATGKNSEDARIQIGQAFENMREFMRQMDGTDASINHVWVFLNNHDYQPDLVDVWLESFPEDGNRPARKTLSYELRGSSQIQVQLTGVLGGARKNIEVPGVSHHDPIPMGSRIGNILHSSGVHGISPDTGEMATDFETQTDTTIEVTRRLLDQAGGTADDVASLTVLLRDLANAPIVAAKLRGLFGDDQALPALRFINYNIPSRMQVQFHITAVLD